LDYAKSNPHFTALLQAMAAYQKSDLSSIYSLANTNRFDTQTKIETAIETRGGGDERKREASA